MLPTLSALHGLLGAAAGIRRGDVVPDWIQSAHMAIRADYPGDVLRDFHTINPPDRARYFQLSDKDRQKVRTVVNADGAERGTPVITERFYRQDQTVTWFIDDPEGLVGEALQEPHFTIFAGRKACTLSFPLLLGRVAGDLESVVSSVPTTAPEGSPLEAIFFERPRTLVEFRPVVSRPERAAGPVGERYVAQERFSCLVDPVRVATWFDVMDLLTDGGSHVAY